MAVHRQVFEVNKGADTGTWCDTGPPATGTVRQVRWAPTGGDTGTAILEILALPVAADTGSAIVIARETFGSGVASNGLTRNYKAAAHTIAGVVMDTGGAGSEYPVLAGESLRVKVNPSGASLKGKLFVYIDN